MPISETAVTERLHEALADARARIALRDDAIVQSQIEISLIAAPTGEEGARAAWLAARFTALGLEQVHIDDAGNVIGRRGGATDEPPLYICAHLDTVFPRSTPLAVRRDGTRVYVPGIGDNGRGLAVMLALAEEIDGIRLRTKRPIVFVGTTGEEGAGDLRGAKHLFATAAVTPAAVIALDGAGDERVVHCALGSRRYRVTYRGSGGHSWAAFGTPNAVHATARAATHLASLPLPKSPRTTLSVARIGGGISVNSIPDEGWMEVDLRSTSAATLARLDRDVHAIVRAAAEQENAKRLPGSVALTADIRIIGDRPCGEVPADDPLVETAIEATRLIGREPDLTVASTDANVPISLGIPSVALGAGGRGGDTHTSGEWFDNTDGQLGVGRALTVLIAAAGLAD